MPDSAGTILLASLTQEEYDSLPSPVRIKIEGVVNEHIENFINSRALFETTRTSNEEKINTLTEQIKDFENKKEEVNNNLLSLKDELAEVSLNLEATKNDNEKLQATIKTLEADCVEYRRQRDLAVDERDEAVKMTERRDHELRRVQEDVETLKAQMEAAVRAKCQALADADEVESTKLALDYREKRLDQERTLINQELQNLNEDLAKKTGEISNMRRENTNVIVTLRAQLEQKNEELKISMSTNKNLTDMNASLKSKLESLMMRLVGQGESENQVAENYQQEIRAQTKLAELYKGLHEDASANNEELTNAVAELQKLLKEASEQYGVLETKLGEKEVALEVTTIKKDECIEALKKELDHANKLIEATKQQSLEKAVETLSPCAAATSRLLKSGLTLTQLYMQYAEVSDELIVEREENKRLSNSIKTILHEIEQKAPILKKQREDYDYAMTTVETLTCRMDEMELETSRLRSANLEAEKLATHMKRENKRLQETLTDLGRQVCFLLKEVEESRGNSVEMKSSPKQFKRDDDITRSSQVISKHLVTFRDLQQLQETNQKLLAVVRELSEKQEQAECDKYNQAVEQVEGKLRLAEARVATLLESESHYQQVLEVVKNQREMYRTLFQQQVAGLPHAKVEELETSANRSLSMSMEVSDTSTQKQTTPGKSAPSAPALEARIEMLEEKLQDKRKELKQLQDDFNTYKKERATNEQMLSESLEKAREDLRAMAVSKSEVVAKAEFAEERFKVLKANADSYKAQIQTLEKKNNNYSVTIGKHEQSITHLKDECVSANSKLSRAEVMLENYQRGNQMLKETEARLLREREATQRQSSGQAMLMANLEMIKASFERTEAEGRLKVEAKLDEAQKECSALRRRLQEEQDRFREKTDALERATQTARSRLDEEKEVSHGLRTQLELIRSELRESKEAVEKLNTKVRITSHKVVPDPETEKRASHLEQQLAEKDGELLCLREQLNAARQHAQELSDIAQSSERQLAEITASHDKHRQEADAKLKAFGVRESEMRKTMADQEARLRVMSNAQEQSTSTLDGKMRSHIQELTSATSELEMLRGEVTALRRELAVARDACSAAQDKYSHEMVLHADDMQAMNKVKRDLTEVEGRVRGLESERDGAAEALRLGREGWVAGEAALTREIDELKQRITDLDVQNELLHQQLQEIGLRMPVTSQCTTSTAALDTSADDDMRTSDQLLAVLKYTRREKNIAVAQADALRAETLRLRAQVELQSRQLNEAKELLDAERSQSQVSVLTTTKHEELLRKVDTLNALTDSNRTLREERDRLDSRVTELGAELTQVEAEVVAPLRERITKLSSQIDQQATEITALRGEAARWRTRANVLVEKQNKNSPDDFRRLTTEKETLTKQLTTANDELKTVKLDKSKLEEQWNNLKREHQQQSELLGNLQKNLAQAMSQLNESRSESEQRNEELNKMKQDFIAQEATLTDIKSKELQIRQIAKKYKTQYQELVRSNEEDKKKKEVVVMSPEEQEKLREEGRREAETRQVDRLKQLTDQAAAAQTEAANLHKENEQLKLANADKEERAKVLLKNARARIMQLTEEKKKLGANNNELKTKVDALDRNKDDSDVRQRRVDKEKADLIAERDRLAREVEILTAKTNLLQRQVDKFMGSKPSTSSGVEKSSGDPPTANIKPMAGPSSSVTKQQPTQHAVTVTPWRGGGSETPFASIRPMSLQSRTVAVLPTTNQSQSVMVPPQQQMVHTSTGVVEGLSSSPTSSHTDYMPASSSGVASVVTIRQATVPPTQLPPPSAESTQDMEVEASQGAAVPAGAANPQAIALVLPQPTAQTSSQTTQTQSQGSGQDSAVGSASSAGASGSNAVSVGGGAPQESSSSVAEQSVVSASSHLPQADQGSLVSASSATNQPAMCSAVPAYYRQEVVEGVPSASVSDQSVVASSESQLAEASNSAEQSGATASGSSYANSSNTVTTSQAGPATKRLRDGGGSAAEEDAAKSMPPAKRSRAVASASIADREGGELLLRADGLEVEYQVPTSSQRDQEDDAILVMTTDEDDDDEEGLPDDGGLDDGQDFEEGDNEEGYEIEVYRDDQEIVSYDGGEGPDIDENITDQDNNEVEIIEDSNEVPNQAESSSAVVGGVGSVGSGGGEATSSVSSAQAMAYTRRASATHITPLMSSRQPPLMLPGSYEEVGDDSIVPSTPTLFVPRHTDGFGEAVSSPHVPSGRFTFSENNPPTTRAGVAQVAIEGMDDTRMDLSQLEDSGTGRSVPSTPLQVSPQEVIAVEVGQSSSSVEQEANNNLHIPTITITMATATVAPAPLGSQEMPPPLDDEEQIAEEGREADEQDGERVALDEQESDPEESGDGVSSEGEKSAAVVGEVEEGREAEATETSGARGLGTARRSARSAGMRARATRNPRTPIVWDEPTDPPSSAARGSSLLARQQRGLSVVTRSSLLEQARGNFRGRARRSRGPFHFQPRF